MCLGRAARTFICADPSIGYSLGVPWTFSKQVTGAGVDKDENTNPGAREAFGVLSLIGMTKIMKHKDSTASCRL